MWYQSQINDVAHGLKDQRKKSTMAFRVGRGHGRRGRPTANVEVMEVVQQMQARLEAMETGSDADASDLSELEVEATEKEELVEVTPKMGFLRSVLKSTSRPRTEVSTYAGGLNPEELID